MMYKRIKVVLKMSQIKIKVGISNIEEQFFVFGSLFDYCEVMCKDLDEVSNCRC